MMRTCLGEGHATIEKAASTTRRVVLADASILAFALGAVLFALLPSQVFSAPPSGPTETSLEAPECPLIQVARRAGWSPHREARSCAPHRRGEPTPSWAQSRGDPPGTMPRRGWREGALPGEC